MNSNKDIREFHGAIITIKGNAMRHGNSVYSIKNIVFMTFDSIKKDRAKPDSITENYEIARFFLKYFLYALFLLGIIIFMQESYEEQFSTFTKEYLNNNLLKVFLLSIPASLILSILFYIIGTIIKWNHVSYYYIHGLRIIFTNNLTLYFAADSNTGFIEQTMNGLEQFISDSEYREHNEMVINFSKRSININEVKDSNIISGDVGGDVNNG